MRKRNKYCEKCRRDNSDNNDEEIREAAVRHVREKTIFKTRQKANNGKFL